MAPVNPRLSICIPTWNRDVYLESLLARVDEELADLRNQVEVIVSDNASTDRTPEVVARYASRPNFRYLRRATNGGGERNFLEVVAAATGEFCWLFGDDDVLMPGAVATVLRALDETGADVLQFASADGPVVAERTGFASLHDFVEHFAKIRPRALLEITVITAAVFRRSLWTSVPDKERLIPTRYVHSLTLAEGLRDGGRIIVLPDALFAVPIQRAPYDPVIDTELAYLHLQYLMTLAWLARSETLERFVRRHRFRVLKSTAGDMMRLTARYVKNLGRFARTVRRSLLARADSFEKRGETR